MTKLLFQLPKGDFEVTPESKTNAMYAMLGVVAISAIVALVFLFQHVMVAPGFGQASGFVVRNAENLCVDPGLIVVDNAVVDFLREQRSYKCGHTNQDAWCCYPPKI